MGRDYLAQMFFLYRETIHFRKNDQYILEHDGRVVYSVTELGQEEGLRTVNA